VVVEYENSRPMVSKIVEPIVLRIEVGIRHPYNRSRMGSNARSWPRKDSRLLHEKAKGGWQMG
jgi:hypothetical protein